MFFRGKGVISALIRWQTDGTYSHVGAYTDDGYVIESKEGKGVRKHKYTDFKDADFYSIDVTPSQKKLFYEFLNSQLGCGYDYWGIVRFVSRRMLPENDNWFCSELMFAAAEAAGIVLLGRTKAYEVSPSLLSRSPYLILILTFLTDEQPIKQSSWRHSLQRARHPTGGILPAQQFGVL